MGKFFPADDQLVNQFIDRRVGRRTQKDLLKSVAKLFRTMPVQPHLQDDVRDHLRLAATCVKTNTAIQMITPVTAKKTKHNFLWLFISKDDM